MTESTGIDAVAEHFGQAPSVFGSSPLYQALCPVVASDRELLELLRRRRPGQQPSFLLFGAVHRFLLGGAGHRLAGYYPSLAGGAALDPAWAGLAFLDLCRPGRDRRVPGAGPRTARRPHKGGLPGRDPLPG